MLHVFVIPPTHVYVAKRRPGFIHVSNVISFQSAGMPGPDESAALPPLLVRGTEWTKRIPFDVWGFS
jgi:hypothetical protein